MFDRERDHRYPHIHSHHISLPLGMLCVHCRDVCLSVLLHLIMGWGRFRVGTFVSLHNNTMYGRGHEEDMRRDSARCVKVIVFCKAESMYILLYRRMHIPPHTEPEHPRHSRYMSPSPRDRQSSRQTGSQPCLCVKFAERRK